MTDLHENVQQSDTNPYNVEPEQVIEAPSTVGETVYWVLDYLKRPPLPENPKECEEQLKNKKGEKQKGGKQPCWLDSHGRAYPVIWSHYQEKLPDEMVLQQWFEYSRGIGTLGGWNGKHYIAPIDFDYGKTGSLYTTQEEMLAAIEKWKEKYPIVKTAPCFKTPSGGYRFILAFEEAADFAPFVLDPNYKGDKCCGELLARNGGHTLLPPTVGVDGIPYEWVYFAQYPPVVKNAASVGLYPKAAKFKQDSVPHESPKKSKPQNTRGVVTLEQCLSNHSQKILRGDLEGKDRSNSLATLLNDVQGWINFLERNEVEYVGDLEQIAEAAWSKFPDSENDPDKWERIAATICSDAQTSIEKTTGSDAGCWDKLRRLGLEVEGGTNQLDPADDAGNNTFEKHVFLTLFEAGEGKWATIRQAFYEDTGHGYWKHVKDDEINQILTHCALKTYKWKCNKDECVPVYPFSRDITITSAYRFNLKALLAKDLPSNNYLRCFNNCTVDMRTGEMLPHNRNHFLTTTIDADYTPNQECPEPFRKFIAASYGEDLLELVRAVTAMLLDPTAPYGKFIHLIGNSGTGKGTLARFWAELFGEHHSSGNFANLGSAEGRHQYLTGAGLYTIPDIGGFVKGVNDFYELVDNGAMSGRALFMSNTYTKPWDCRFIVASVDHLKIENSGDGWDRRCIPLPTRGVKHEEDPDLRKKLSACKEGVISWALAMDKQERDRLLLNPGSVSSRVSSIKTDARTHSDSIAAFVDSCLVPNKNRTFVDNSSLYAYYKAYCEAHGSVPKGQPQFVSHLKTILPNFRVEQRPWTLNPDGTRDKQLPRHWRWIDVISTAFNVNSYIDTDSTDVCCYRSKCKEGGLQLFEEFVQGLGDCAEYPAQNDIPEPSSYIPVQDVQGVQGLKKGLKKKLT